ncbi:MAG: HDOD domain-containing protein [Candidatus Sericytochromatia bacterium]|nr:HDOD domain-containing protein [Candidatus Sericytochromatia bacterium]
MRELSIRNILNRVDELPEVPQTALRVIQLLNDPDTDVASLADVISSDQALTAKVLRLCNSAYYGLSRKVTTISEAVMIIGFSSIKSLVMMITTQSTLNKGLLGYKLNAGYFWEHSIGAAEISRYLAVQLKHREPEECFIAGLIHDIGKMVLNQYALPEVYKATNLHQKEQIPVYEAEQQILSFDHAAIGGALAERWNFPPMLVESIRRHHTFEPLYDNGKIDLLPTLVATANLLVKMLHEDTTARLRFEQHAPLIEEVLGIRVLDLEKLLPILAKKVDETRQLALLMT